MGEKAKNAILDILKSDDMRAYFEELLRGQTRDILSFLREAEETRSNDEIQKLNDQLTAEKERLQELNNQLAMEKENSRSLESKIKDIEALHNTLQKSYEEKSSDYEEILQHKKKCESQVLLTENENEKLKCEIIEERKKADRELRVEKEEKKQALNKLKEYQDKFACISSAYTHYEKLPASIKQRVGNIFVRDNIYSFIVAVSDWKSIEGLWSFTKRRIIEDEKEGLSELVALFADSFTLFSLIDGSGRYELIRPVIGERFDSDKHSIKGLKTDGQIAEVLLNGIYDSATNKAVFKAVVQIQ